eukprot:10070008-Heterocapsa_arctica.AAC.1
MSASAPNSVYLGDKATGINATAIHRMDCELETLLVVLHSDGKEFLGGPLRFRLIKIGDLEPATHIDGLNL